MLNITQVYRARWFRPVVAIVVIVLSATLGFLSVRYNPYLMIAVAGMPLILIGLELTSRRLFVAPIIILMIATTTAWDLAKGITPALVLTGGFAAFWLLRQMSVTRQLEFVRSPVTAPAIAFAFVALVSLLEGSLGADPLLINWPGFELVVLGQLSVLVLGPIVLILTGSLLKNARHLRYLVYGFLSLAALGMIAEVMRFPFRLDIGGLTNMWVVSLIYGQLLFNRGLSNWLRVGFVILLCIWLYDGFLLGITWLAGWLPGMIAIGVLSFLRSKKLLLSLVILVVIGIWIFGPWLQARYDAEYTESGSTRMERWTTLLEQPFVRDNWLLGTGPAGYAHYLMTYTPTDAMASHSNYIDIYLQMGVVGLGVLIWLMGALARVGFRLRTVPIQDPFIAGFVPSALAGLVGLLVAMAMGDWFTPFVYTQGLAGYSWTVNSWIFLGALVAVPAILQRGQ